MITLQRQLLTVAYNEHDHKPTTMDLFFNKELWDVLLTDYAQTDGKLNELSVFFDQLQEEIAQAAAVANIVAMDE